MKFTSRVIAGRRHGRTIGYPTANLEINPELESALPQAGVYAVRVGWDGKKYGGALFYGCRSLFKDAKLVCEVLLIDFAGDLYGDEIEIDVVKYLRPVRNVIDEAELKRLIEQDIANTNQLFNQ